MAIFRRREEVIVCNVVLLDGSNIRIDVPVSSTSFVHSCATRVLFTNDCDRSGE